MDVVGHINVRSLMAPGRLAELKLFSSMHEPDVLCVTETWLTNKHLDQTLAIPGYQLPNRCDRKFSRGGSVAIYLRNGLAVSRLPIVATTEFQVFEHVAIRLDFPKRKTLYVFAVYRPPKQDMEVFLDCLEKAITPYSHKNGLLVEDFNAKHMDGISPRQLMLRESVSKPSLIANNFFHWWKDRHSSALQALTSRYWISFLPIVLPTVHQIVCSHHWQTSVLLRLIFL